MHPLITENSAKNNIPEIYYANALNLWQIAP